ncbi:MAG: nicotinamide mononucleotide transporter [Clostridiales bacterium]|nr:nicotinamide mononucleotide transporter [Clostridiales bacterium]
MKLLNKFLRYFSISEIILWCISIAFIIVPYLVFDSQNFGIMLVSLLGVTAIVFIAKGNPFGQLMMMVFGIVYAILSYEMKYYGEMITYAGMTVPMALSSLISWLKNPFEKDKLEVEIATLTKKDYILTLVFAVIVTVIFHFVLKFFGTANIVVSTISITTSFIAVFLTYKRSEFFALGYLLNDIVLIVLWVMACYTDIKYVSVVSSFVAFMFMDSYTFINWSRIKRKQQKAVRKSAENTYI